jgi:hypothetical protein
VSAGNRRELVQFMNSDPGMILLFLRFLEAAGVSRQQIHYRVCIHETAGVAAAERFWLDVTGADPSRFHKATLKRHNPKTTRKTWAMATTAVSASASGNVRTSTGGSKAGPVRL